MLAQLETRAMSRDSYGATEPPVHLECPSENQRTRVLDATGLHGDTQQLGAVRRSITVGGSSGLLLSYLGKNDSSRTCSREYGHVGGKFLISMPVSIAAALRALG